MKQWLSSIIEVLRRPATSIVSAMLVVGSGLAALASASSGAAQTALAEHAPSDAHPFEVHTIATDLTGGYQPLVVDLNRDGRLDVIALSFRLDELAWFESPDWQKHVLTRGVNRPINVAAHDIDADGIPELVLAHEFGTTHETSLGVISLLTHPVDPTQPWHVREIDRAPTSHRLRWADIDGTGRKVLVNAPLAGPAATPPEYRDAVPIYWYDPTDWSRHLVTDAEQGVVHGLLAKRWPGSDRDAVLTASFIGIHLHQWTGRSWARTQLTPGDPAPWPLSGSSEIEIGRIGEEPFLATIEPWHGDQVVVYRSDDNTWRRHVIDTIDGGHTIVTADVDGDGRDEIVTGDRGETRNLYIYTAIGPDGSRWSRQIIDDGDMAPSGCVAADLDADSRQDLVCIGGGTANLKWYRNLSQ